MGQMHAGKMNCKGNRGEFFRQGKLYNVIHAGNCRSKSL
jgi:hypothetical protein